ncbi:MAG: hypothetical protein DWQ31_06915 [Planctomycetota bacterium]|nr:MAG: hypothetical protein DWQ31_06915 [Planctomycetota bacterium]REJ93000.1 MAG: hypothetical protein DWQ35_11215 [Planctomycetota bacterium]REK22656.1 MAG: hypothetical protein DWQ42_16670 [Planctomycetota bacterium]REK37783.1 MAG: hypothetical protein DWQ46_21780 [Planctomycetota bacterium]
MNSLDLRFFRNWQFGLDATLIPAVACRYFELESFLYRTGGSLRLHRTTGSDHRPKNANSG